MCAYICMHVQESVSENIHQLLVNNCYGIKCRLHFYCKCRILYNALNESATCSLTSKYYNNSLHHGK